MKNLILFLFAFISTATFAKQVECVGTKTAQNYEALLPSKALLQFELTKNDSQYILSNFEAKIMVLGGGETEEVDLDESNSYIGIFNLESISSNLNYRPLKYKGHTQFRNVDATDTFGYESGMWGSLVLDLRKDVSEFKAYYIFQAGDHMGGTLLLNCQII